MSEKWIPITSTEPPISLPVKTRIDDGKGVRNEAILKRGGANGNLWFFEDDSMYVYYRPTHYVPDSPEAQAERKARNQQRASELRRQAAILESR